MIIYNFPTYPELNINKNAIHSTVMSPNSCCIINTANATLLNGKFYISSSCGCSGACPYTWFKQCGSSPNFYYCVYSRDDWYSGNTFCYNNIFENSNFSILKMCYIISSNSARFNAGAYFKDECGCSYTINCVVNSTLCCNLVFLLNYDRKTNLLYLDAFDNAKTKLYSCCLCFVGNSIRFEMSNGGSCNGSANFTAFFCCAAYTNSAFYNYYKTINDFI